MLLDRDPRSVRIERLMAERSRSFRWLAEKLGTSHVSVRKWILGEAKPRDDAVWRQMLDLLEESGSVSHVDNLLARGFALTAAVPSWLGARASLDPMDEEEFDPGRPGRKERRVADGRPPAGVKLTKIVSQ